MKRAFENDSQENEMSDYDAGMLSDYGGGNVDWWWDYLRSEVERANTHWQVQVEALTAERDALRAALQTAVADCMEGDEAACQPSLHWVWDARALIADNLTPRDETAV